MAEDQNHDSQGRKRKRRNLKPNVIPTINMLPPLFPDQISDKPSTRKSSRKSKLAAKNQLSKGRFIVSLNFTKRLTFDTSFDMNYVLSLEFEKNELPNFLI